MNEDSQKKIYNHVKVLLLHFIFQLISKNNNINQNQWKKNMKLLRITSKIYALIYAQWNAFEDLCGPFKVMTLSRPLFKCKKMLCFVFFSNSTFLCFHWCCSALMIAIVTFVFHWIKRWNFSIYCQFLFSFSIHLNNLSG